MDSSFLELHEKVKKQVESFGRGIINPRTSKWVHQWDGVTFVCLIFTALVTPVEVCVIGTTHLERPTHFMMFVINQLINLFFFADVVLNFFLAYQEPANKGGRWVTHRKQIVRHYLRTWFVIDLVSILPFDLITTLNLISVDDSSASLLRIVRTIRLIRLVKLLRILRASRILARWQNYIGISFAQMGITKLLAVAIWTMHMMACVWAWQGLNWVASEGSTLEHESTWIVAYNYTEYSKHRLYTLSLYVSVVAMFGGVGSIVPQNFAEYVVYTVMMVFGSFVWAYVIGSFCGILSTLNPHAIAFQNMMDELNLFMSDRNFHMDHRVRLREFFRQTQEFARAQEYDKLLAKMSTKLRSDTALIIGKGALSRVWYLDLAHVEHEFLSVAALALRAAVYEAREQMPVTDLTVITMGITARRLLISTKGDVLGIDCIIPDERVALRENDPANCLTFVQVVCITRHELFTIVEHFPVAQQHLAHASLIMTLRGAFKKYFAWHKHDRLQRKIQLATVGCSAVGGGGGSDGGGGLQIDTAPPDTDRRRTTFLARSSGSDALASIMQRIEARKARPPAEGDGLTFSRSKSRQGSGTGGAAGWGSVLDMASAGGFEREASGGGLRDQVDDIKRQAAEARREARGHHDELLLRQDQLGHQIAALQGQLELVLQVMSHGVHGAARTSGSPHLSGSKSRPVGMREVAGSKLVMRRRKGAKAEKESDSPAIATDGVISTRIPVARLPATSSPCEGGSSTFPNMAAAGVEPVRSDTWGTATPPRRPSAPTVGEGLGLSGLSGGELGGEGPCGGLGARLRSLQGGTTAQAGQALTGLEQQPPHASYPNRLSA